MHQKLLGLEITLKFTIEKKGRTTRVDTQKRPRSNYYPQGRDFAVQMIQAVKNWRFEPALGTNGEAKALTALIPVKVTQCENKAVAQASFKPCRSNETCHRQDKRNTLFIIDRGPF